MPGPLNFGGTGGGFPSGPLGNIDVGSLVQAATQPPGIQFLQGLATLPGAFQQAQSDAADAQTKRLQAKDFQMKIAQNQWDQTVSMIQKKPELAYSPAVIKQMTGLSATLGYQLPTDSRGGVDTSVWGTSLTDFIKDKDLAQRWFAADKPGKQTLARLYHLSGITEDDYNAAPVRTANEQYMFDKYGVDKEKADSYVKNQALYTAARTNQLYSLSADERAQASKAYNDGTAALSRARSYAQHINDELTIANNKNSTAIQVASIHSSGSQVSYKSALHASETAVRQATELYGKLKADIGTAIANGASPDDQEVQDLDAQAKAAQKGIDAANTQLRDVQQMGPGLQQDAAGRAVTQQSGKPQATVTNAQQGGNYVVGQRYTDSQGRSAIYLGSGQWQPAP